MTDDGNSNLLHPGERIPGYNAPDPRDDARQLLLDAFAELGEAHSYGFDLEEIPNTLRKWGLQKGTA